MRCELRELQRFNGFGLLATLVSARSHWFGVGIAKLGLKAPCKRLHSFVVSDLGHSCSKTRSLRFLQRFNWLFDLVFPRPALLAAAGWRVGQSHNTCADGVIMCKNAVKTYHRLLFSMRGNMIIFFIKRKNTPVARILG